MAVAVRPATEADIDGIRAVAEAAWHAAHESIIGAEAVESFLAEYYDADTFRDILAEPGTVLSVAIDDADGVVGFVAARPDEVAAGTFQLNRLYVAPDRWGEGFGRRLLERAEAAVDDRGGDRIELGVMAENDRAIAFYEAAGYDRVDEFHDERIDTAGYTYVKAL